MLLGCRLRVVRQPRNLNYGNFRWVLTDVETPLFMFAPGDDWWAPTFVEACIAALDADVEACCAVPRIEFIDVGSELPPGSGTYVLRGSVSANIATYLRAPRDNSRMYGIFRTPAAQAAFPHGDHFAFDWTFSAATLLHGTHIELPQTLMRRELTARERYVGYVNRDNSGMLDRLFPLLPMTRALLYEKRVPRTLAVYRALAFANLEYHLAWANKYHTVYSKLAGPLLRRVLWRI